MEESSDSYESSADDSDSSPASATEEGTAQETTSQEQPSKEKKARKPRKPNKLTNDTFKITKIDGRGVPVSPVKHAKTFSNAVGCIVRETVKITCTDIRAKDMENLRDMMFNRLFNRYTFENDEMKSQVRHKALGMMTKALSTWRHRANKMKDQDFEEVISKRWPQIKEDDWKQFLVRLWALYLVRETRQNKELASVGVADPFHMHDDNLSSDEGIELILWECIFPALQENKDKKYILVPYNPTGHWVLIILMVKECKAFYLDSLKNRAQRDYTVLSQILDDALFQHCFRGGTVPRRGKGRVCFKHYTDVSCTQQQDSVSCGYYLCYHMDKFVRSQQTLNKSVDIQLFGTHLESNPFECKKEFTRIQDILAKTINSEVVRESGLFYCGDDSLEVNDSRTKAAATQLIKHA